MRPLIVIPGVTALGLVAFALMLLVVKLLWGWTIPDLFPGAVAQGLVAAKITWVTALKLTILLVVLAGISGAATHRG